MEIMLQDKRMASCKLHASFGTGLHMKHQGTQCHTNVVNAMQFAKFGCQRLEDNKKRIC